MGGSGARAYGIPISGGSTVANTEAACVSAGLKWLTQSTSNSASRSTTQTTFWGTDGGWCSSQSQYGISQTFCGGACNADGNGQARCQNLATYVSDDWGGGNACTNPAGESFCSSDGREDMKALCVDQ